MEAIRNSVVLLVALLHIVTALPTPPTITECTLRNARTLPVDELKALHAEAMKLPVSSIKRVDFFKLGDRFVESSRGSCRPRWTPTTLPTVKVLYNDKYQLVYPTEVKSVVSCGDLSCPRTRPLLKSKEILSYSIHMMANSCIPDPNNPAGQPIWKYEAVAFEVVEDYRCVSVSRR